MYPFTATAQYHALPTDPDRDRDHDPECPPPSPAEHQRHRGPTPYDRLTPKPKPTYLLYLRLRPLSVLLILLTCLTYTIARLLSPLLGPEFIFDLEPKPAYLSTPREEPLVLRMAVISRVDAFERREAIRGSVLGGVPGGDVKMEYKFFVGRVPDARGEDVEGKSGVGGEEGRSVQLERERERVRRRLEWESELYGDVVRLDGVEDVPERVAEKRFAALQWANEVPPHEYDYLLTIDDDTFCRLAALARRMRSLPLYTSLRPREQPVLVGSMRKHGVYWVNTVRDDGDDDVTGVDAKKEEDKWVAGPEYPYPVGIGYMLSSNLTATILSADPAVPHHIHYPYDDVMIGSWVSAFEQLHDASAIFHSPSPPPSSHTPKTPPKTPRETEVSARPVPYLPYAVHTTIIDDKPAWHDYKRRGSVRTAHAVGWETGCVHRVGPAEMRALRGMEEVSGEWDW